MLFWLLVLLFLAATTIGGLWGYRYYVTGDPGFPFALSAWFGPRPEPRLGISEQATIDNRRRLVLIRRELPRAFDCGHRAPKDPRP